MSERAGGGGRGERELDQRVGLLGPQGIFKPKVMPELPLSITTVPIARIHAPRAAGLRPAQDFLAVRFELFRKAV